MRVIAVNAVGDGPPSDEATGTPLSWEERLRRFVDSDVVQEYEADHPWLRTVWTYMSRPEFDILVIDDPARQGEVTISCGESSVSGLESCEALELRIGADHLRDERVVIREMAHLYTLANDIATEPAPLGIAHLYFDSLEFSVNRTCEPTDLYADVMTIDALGHVRLAHWGECNGTNANGIEDTLTREALTVVGSALEGDAPQWFADTYNDAGGEPDLERVWADLKAVEVGEDDELDTRVTVVYQLRDAFGGYCDGEKAGDSIFDDGETRNPWRDGGCVPEAPVTLTAVVGSAEMSLSWEVPDYDGGSPIEGYRVQWKSGSEEYDDTPTSTQQAEVTDPANLARTIPGLTNGVEYTARVLAYNHNGVGAASAEVRATPEAPNSPATGAPTITGTARVGETLTALTNDIADGLTSPGYSYQWLADGAEIAGATSSAYVPAADDQDKAIRVRVSFTDDRNHQESLTSAATVAVAPAPDGSATWSATLAVGSYSGGFIRGFWEDLGVGALTTEVFTLDGVDYTVTQLTDFAGNVLNLTLDRELPVGFTLQVGDATLSSGDADIIEQGSGEFQYSWWNQGVTLAVGDTVEVSLVLAE